MRVLAVTSGKGGVGKTNVSVNLALALAQSGSRVLLLDADLSLANVDVLLGVRPTHSLQNLVDGTATLDEVLMAVADDLDLLPATSGILRLERLTHEQRINIADELAPLEDRYDWLILDTGAGLTANVLFFNALADHVLLVTVPEPTALTDTYAMLKVLTRTYQISSIAVLINQVATAVAAEAVHTRLREVSNKFLGVDLPLAGYIPMDPNLPRAVTARRPLLDHAPGSIAARSLRLLAKRLPRLFDEPAPRREGSFWRGWARGTSVPPPEQEQTG